MTIKLLRQIAEFHATHAQKARDAANSLESCPLPTEQLTQANLIRNWRSQEAFHSAAADSLTNLANQIPPGVTLTHPITHHPIISP